MYKKGSANRRLRTEGIGQRTMSPVEKNTRVSLSHFSLYVQLIFFLRLIFFFFFSETCFYIKKKKKRIDLHLRGCSLANRVSTLDRRSIPSSLRAFLREFRSSLFLIFLAEIVVLFDRTYGLFIGEICLKVLRSWSTKIWKSDNTSALYNGRQANEPGLLSTYQRYPISIRCTRS